MKRTAFAACLFVLGSLFLFPAPPPAAQGGPDSWSLPADFSSVQGQDQWFYYRESSASYVPLVWDPYVNGLGAVGNCWSPQVGGADQPRYLYIQGSTAESVVVQPGENANVAIGWQAPRAGSVSIVASMTAVSTSTDYSSWCPGCNDGTDFYIRHNSATVAGPAFVLHGSPEFQSNSLAADVTVSEGDFIYFYVDRRKWQDADAAYADFTISYGVVDGVWNQFQAGAHLNNRLHDVSVVTANNAWAVGNAGTILHYTVGMGRNVGSWSRVAGPTSYDLYSLDMLSAGDGWAVGQAGAVSRYSNGSWGEVTLLSKLTHLATGTQITPVDLYAVDTISATEAWAAGTKASLFHYSGGDWHEETVTGTVATADRTLYDLQMLSAADGWAVGDGGAILRFDGTQWDTVAGPNNRTLRSLNMVSAQEGWAVGDQGTILHYTTAGGWQAAVSPVTTTLNSVSMTSAGSGWAVGAGGVLLRYTSATGWVLQPSLTPNTLRSVQASAGGFGWAVGSAGTLLRYGLPAPNLRITSRPTLVNRGESARFVLTVRDLQGAPITDATVTATLWSPVSLWGGGAVPYQAASGGYVYTYAVPAGDPIGAYRVQFLVECDGYVDTSIWGYFGVGGDENVWVLLLTNFPRMRALGYGNEEVVALQNKVYDLAYGNPNGLGAIMNLDGLPAYTAWAADPGDAGANNTLVYAIDSEIERVRRDVFPNLAYVIIVGSSEVIPMYARDDDPTWVGNNEDTYWSNQLDDTSYVRKLSYHGADGRYLTDNVYADLAYLDHDDDHELTPELMVGRLVETPTQIGRLIDDYLRLGGQIQAHAVALASTDQLDTGNAVFSGYPGGVDRSNVQSHYPTANVATSVTASNVYLLAGHGNRQGVSTGYDSFAPGACDSGTSGTYDVRTAEGSVMFTVSCHAGTSMGNKLHNDPTTDDVSCPSGTQSYLDFPETWADLGLMAYAGSTSYALGTASGDQGYTWMTGGTETLVELMTRSGLLVGRTVGQAFRDGMNSYWNGTRICVGLMTPFGCVGFWGHTDYNRKAIGGYVLYGIPTLRVNGPATTGGLGAMAEAPVEPVPTVQRQVLSASAGEVVEQVTVEIPVYRFQEQAGVVEIPGAVQRVVPGEPYLPVLAVERTLPLGATVTGITIDTTQSTSVELNGHLAVPSLMGGDTPIPNSFTATDYYPAGLALALENVSGGGHSTTAGMTLIPVQYNPATGKVRVWTKIVAGITYTVPDTGVLVTSLVTNKATYSETETVALTAGVSNAGGARVVDALVRLYDARTGAALGETLVATGLSLAAGAGSQPFSFALSALGASPQGKQLGIELQLYDSATGVLLASGETTVAVGDQTAPCAPVGLRTIPGDGTVALAWQPCSEDDVWTYKVYWGTDAAALSQSAEVPASTARHTVSGLTNLATYHLAVAAVDVAGHEGARSQVVSAMPGLRVYLPQTAR